MKALKKAAMACMAVGMISAVAAGSAFAADVASEANYADGKVSVADERLGTIGGQMTVLVLAKDADNDGIDANEILYIDQQEDGTTIFQGMGVKGGKLEDGEYVVKIGGENLDEIIVIPFVVGNKGTTIQLGDCDGIEGIDIRDVSALLQHIAETKLLTGDYLVAGDCDGVEGIDIRDVSAVLQHIAETKLLGTVTK